VRHIGVSNFGIHHLEELFQHCTVKPAVNQIEVHVFLARKDLVEFSQKHGIVVEAYSPLAKAQVLTNPGLNDLARAVGKTPAQVLLRYCIQRGLVILPKSVNPERMKENMDVFSFELGKDEMEMLMAMDEHLVTGWDPTVDP
jgi:diketogulonate reductase-like aldo/keto reductase